MTKSGKALLTRRHALALLGAGVPLALAGGAAFAHDERQQYGGHMHGRGYHHGHDDDHHHGRGHHHGYGDETAHHGHAHRHGDDDHGPHHHGEHWREDGKKES